MVTSTKSPRASKPRVRRRCQKPPATLATIDTPDALATAILNARRLAGLTGMAVAVTIGPAMAEAVLLAGGGVEVRASA